MRQAPSDFHTKEKVLGITVGDAAKAYPFSELSKHGLHSFEDELGGVKYRVLWNFDAQSANVKSLTDEVLTPTVEFWFACYNFYPQTDVFKAE